MDNDFLYAVECKSRKEVEQEFYIWKKFVELLERIDAVSWLSTTYDIQTGKLLDVERLDSTEGYVDCCKNCKNHNYKCSYVDANNYEKLSPTCWWVTSQDNQGGASSNCEGFSWKDYENLEVSKNLI